VIVILANNDHDVAAAEAERIYQELCARGLEVLLDDRDARGGEKFADADLIGVPLQVIVGKRGIEAGTVDLKLRATGERATVPLADAVVAAADLLAMAP
jgi:prolyl-tRNA synthetase